MLVVDKKFDNCRKGKNVNGPWYIIVTSFLCTLIFLFLFGSIGAKFFINIPPNTGDACMNFLSINSRKIDLNDSLSHISEFYSTIIIVLTTLLVLVQVVHFIFIKNSSTQEIESQVSTWLNGDVFKYNLNAHVSKAVDTQLQDKARELVRTSFEEITSDIYEKLSVLKQRLESLEGKDPNFETTPQAGDEDLVKKAQSQTSKN